MKKWLAGLLSLLFLCGMFVVVSAEPEEEYIQLYISMTIEQFEDGSFEVSLVDDQGGTVSGWPVLLEIDGEEVERINTDGYGTAYFDYDIPDDAQSVAVTSYSGPYDVYYFNGATEVLTWDSNDTTSDEPLTDETTTTVQDQDMTTSTGGCVQTTTLSETSASTLAVSPMTTKVKDAHVLVGVDVDAGVLSSSQLDKTTVLSKATMKMDKDLYASLVSTKNATIHLEMRRNAMAITTESMIAAKNANPAYAAFEDSTVVGYAFDTGLVYVDGDTRVPLEVADDEFTISFPVPATMKYSEKIAVTVCTNDGLAALQEVVPSDGMLNFTVQRFQTLAIIGFGNDPVDGAGVQMPWYLMVMIVVGVLLILGGVALLVFVGLRRAKSDVDTVDDIPYDDVISVEPQDMMLDREVADAVTADWMVTKENDTVESTQNVSVAPSFEKKMTEFAVAASAKASSESLSADDLLGEVLSDLENLDTK